MSDQEKNNQGGMAPTQAGALAPTNDRRDAMKTVCAGVVLLLGGCWFWHYCVGNPFDELALIRGARTGPAVIVDAEEDVGDGPRGEARWFHSVAYRYRLPDGREFTQRTRDYPGRLKDDFRDLNEPYPIEVEYLPDNPNVSRVKGEGSNSLVEWLWRSAGLGLVLLGLFTSPGVVLVMNGIQEIKRSRAAS